MSLPHPDATGASRPAAAETIRILHLEDDRDDALLVASVLEAEGLECEIVNVDSRQGFAAALEMGGFQAVLSDYALPSFDGISALAMTREMSPDLPFIFISGTMGEELAIETLKAGATDYVLKDRLSRLVPSLRRGLAEAREREERRHLEAQLRQSQKMEAIGTLAGGVAHDFNNLLTTILGYGDLLLQQLKPGDPLRGDVEEIRKAGERAATLTRQLLAFSRKQVLDLVVLDLRGVIAELGKMLRRVIGEDVTMVTVPDAESCRVKADAGQIDQVVLNLVVNARDAMPRGGTLTIETRSVELDEAYVIEHPYALPGPYVMLMIRDTGSGMDQATKARIFEPFFTTKPPGKGTGLGLSMVYGIVKQSGGSIEVESEPGRGTTFRVYLPRVSGQVERVAPAVRSVAPAGHETILLVEDEPGVRALSRRILEIGGYTVLEAPSAETAVVVAKDHPAPVHLLVTDTVMPGASGPELARLLASARPLMKVLYVSGYADDAIVHHGLFRSHEAFLQKPFGPATLLRRVREILDFPSEIS